MTETTDRKTYNKRQGGTYEADARDFHPDYAFINSAPKPFINVTLATPGSADMHYGMFEFANEYVSPKEKPEARKWRLARAEVLGEMRQDRHPPGGGSWDKAPGKWWQCHGDGETAMRYAGRSRIGRPGYVEVPCDGEECPFHELGMCSPSLDFYVRIHGDKKGALAHIHTRSPQSIQNYDRALETALAEFREKGIPTESLRDRIYLLNELPLRIQIAEKTGEDTKYPTLRFGVIDLAGFIKRKTHMLDQAIERSCALRGIEAPRLLAQGDTPSAATQPLALPAEIAEASGKEDVASEADASVVDDSDSEALSVDDEDDEDILEAIAVDAETRALRKDGAIRVTFPDGREVLAFDAQGLRDAIRDGLRPVFPTETAEPTREPLQATISTPPDQRMPKGANSGDLTPAHLTKVRQMIADAGVAEEDVAKEMRAPLESLCCVEGATTDDLLAEIDEAVQSLAAAKGDAK
jgi:hypothetical protein